MIVRERPGPFRLLFQFQASIVREILPQLLFILVTSAVVVCLREKSPVLFRTFAAVPFALFGIVISIFTAFRNSASYDRWYEARKAWGSLVIETRCLGREVVSLLPVERHRLMVSGIIAYVHALKTHLRGVQPLPSSIGFLYEQGVVIPQANPNFSEVILQVLQRELVGALNAGELSDIVYASVVVHLNSFATVQGVCERIAATPAPYTYRILLHRFVWLLCIVLPFGLASALGWYTPLICTLFAYGFFGIDALTEELERPFSDNPNALPLNALTRLIEVNLLTAIGDDPPPGFQEPVGFILD